MLARSELNDNSFNIEETGRFCTERMRDATSDLVAAYLTVGKALSELHGKLKKTAPKGDNEHVGWKQAFKQRREDGSPVFPFGRTTAEKCIKVSDFFEAMAMAPKVKSSLPSALGALVTIADFKLTRAQLEKAIAEKVVTTFSQANDIKKLAKQLGLVPSEDKVKAAVKAKPKRERIAMAFEYLAKVGITLDDLIKETGG